MLPKYIVIKIINYIMLTHNVTNLKSVCKLWRRAVNCRFYNSKKLSQLVLNATILLDKNMINYLRREGYNLIPYNGLLKLYGMPHTLKNKIYKFGSYMEAWCKFIPANVFDYMHANNLLKEKHYKYILEYNSDVDVCKTAANKLAISGRTCVEYPEIPYGTINKLIKLSPRIAHRIIKTNINNWSKNEPICNILSLLNGTELLDELQTKYSKLFKESGARYSIKINPKNNNYLIRANKFLLNILMFCLI